MALYNLQLDIPKHMLANNVCFHCAMWQRKIGHMDPESEIIGGRHYIVKPYTQYTHYFSGFRGKTFYIIKKDGTVKRTNNLIEHGSVPDAFKDIFPDTAKFIDKSLYYKARNYTGFKCGRIGCWDRYGCIWYNKDLQEQNGPWNEVPEGWQIGGEKCKIFIPKFDEL